MRAVQCVVCLRSNHLCFPVWNSAHALQPTLKCNKNQTSRKVVIILSRHLSAGPIKVPLFHIMTSLMLINVENKPAEESSNPSYQYELHTQLIQNYRTIYSILRYFDHGPLAGTR